MNARNAQTYEIALTSNSQHDQYKQRYKQYKSMLRLHIEEVGRARRSVLISQMAAMLDISHATSYRMMSVVLQEPWLTLRAGRVMLAPEEAQKVVQEGLSTRAN